MRLAIEYEAFMRFMKRADSWAIDLVETIDMIVDRVGDRADDQMRARILWSAERWVGVRFDAQHQDRSWAITSTLPRAFDAASFVCRVAMDALGYSSAHLSNSASWLLDHLVGVTSPTPGDVVAYGRTGSAQDLERGDDLTWHVMIYYGVGQVIGACDLAGCVVVRDIEYVREYGERQWHLASPPYRALRVRTT